MNTLANWNAQGWRDEVEAWIHDALDGEVILEIEDIQNRPWSRVLRISTPSKLLYFKATDGLSAHEVPVIAFLSRLEPAHSPVVRAVHPENSWLIMEDAGQRLRETLIAKADWQHWEKLLVQYAKVQQAAGQAPSELLACGLPNRSLTELPQLYSELLGETELYRIDLEGGVSSSGFERLQALTPLVRQKAEALAAYGLPETVHHGDLHDGNIFHEGDRYSFYDWGDSTYSHPFISLRTAYVSAEIRFRLEENAPELDVLRDAYLPAWRDYGSEEDLLAAFGLAEALWAIPTALNWQAQILKTEGTEREEFAHIMPSLAEEILNTLKA